MTAGSGAITVVAGPAVDVSIYADTSNVVAGGTLALDATVVDAYTNELTLSTVLWSTTEGMISGDGVLRSPQQAGTVIVTRAWGLLMRS